MQQLGTHLATSVSKDLTVGQLDDTGKALLVSMLYKKGLKPGLILTVSYADSSLIKEKLTSWGVKATLINKPEDPTKTQQIIKLLTAPTKEPYILSIELAQKIGLSATSLKNPIELQKKGSYKINSIVEQLVDLNYETDNHVFTPGTFSKRGEVLDLFPPNLEHPVRLGFNDNMLDSIYLYDPLTGDKLKDLTRLSLIPNSLGTADTTLAEYIQAQPLNMPLIVLEPDQFPEPFWHNWVAPKIFLSGLPQKTNIQINSVKNYAGNINLFQKELGEFAQKDYKIFIHTNIPQELTTLTLGTAVTILDKPIGEPFISPKLKTVYLTDKEIFGHDLQSKNERARIKRIQQYSFGFAPGDLVVHVDHGLGLFEGLIRRTFENTEREYIYIRYAGEDKLYVPVELSDKITRYNQPSDSSPKLNSLGSEEWEHTKNRVKESALRFAKELLDLYAQRAVIKRPPYFADVEWQHVLASSFPYPETPDQAQAIKDVLQDLEAEEPMDRLVSADVGYGKTEVAIRAAVKAVASNKQVAFLTPTTILAEQHYETLSKRLATLPINISLLSRTQSKSSQAQTLQALKDGTVDIVVGTHRILQKDIVFKNLGLLIIDEEQRFGVKQKELLRNQRAHLDTLTLTATPIPRTLYFCLSGIREISYITTPPENRQPIETVVTKYTDETVVDAVNHELKRHGQVYYLHNEVTTIAAKAQYLAHHLGNKVKIAIAHGQQKPQLLIQTMRDLAAGKIDVLVCTTIIENGLDLPNVNTLIVEDATDFGLSQLHQLRGRIGRGATKAYAYFLYGAQKLTKDALLRLQALSAANYLGAGQEIATRDLELRGSGNILGQEQHGNILSVGLSLYTRLLEEAVNELKTGKHIDDFETTIDIPLNAYLPESYIPTGNERIVTYQKLAAARSIDELAQEVTALKKRYGKPPIEAQNLISLITLKINAAKYKIENLKTIDITTPYGEHRRKLALTLNNQSTFAKTILTKSYKIEYKDNKLYLDLTEFGDKWFELINRIIK